MAALLLTPVMLQPPSSPLHQYHHWLPREWERERERASKCIHIDDFAHAHQEREKEKERMRTYHRIYKFI
jgi:hypothetical protein